MRKGFRCVSQFVIRNNIIKTIIVGVVKRIQAENTLQ